MNIHITSRIALFASMAFGAAMAILSIADAGQTAISVTAVVGGMIVAMLWIAAGQHNSRHREH